MKTYINELNKIDTSEKAYLLGFLYGDGCIMEYHNKNRKRFRTKISIHEKDKALIEDLNILFPFFKMNTFDYSKYNKNSGTQHYIFSESKKLFDDLKKHGLFTRKSYENKENLRLPQLSISLMRDFIRGFFDADGSVYKVKNRKNLIKVSITSNSNYFINDLNEYLKSSDINSWQLRKRNPTGKGKQIYYEIEIIKVDEIVKFKEFIYTECDLYLKRKKQLFDQFRIVDKVLDREINCPKCNSMKTIKNGKRKNKIRMECKNCKRGFTI